MMLVSESRAMFKHHIAEWQESKEAESAEEDDAAAIDGDDEGGTSPRDAMIATLRLLILAGTLMDKAFPQELDKADNSDGNIDLCDLAERLNECVPNSESVDLSAIAFDKKNVTEGRRFTMAVPDERTVIKDYEESMLFTTQTRLFVVAQSDANGGEDLSNRDRIIYSSLHDGMKLVVVWDDEVQAANTRCSLPSIRPTKARTALSSISIRMPQII